jgi:hypothetical protein
MDDPCRRANKFPAAVLVWAARRIRRRPASADFFGFLRRIAATVSNRKGDTTTMPTRTPLNCATDGRLGSLAKPASAP